MAANPRVDEAVEAVGLTKLWDARLPLSSGEAIKDVFLVDEVLYASTTRGILFALQADVGLIRWGVKITEPGYRIFPPAHVPAADGSGDTIAVATNGFWLLDRFSGDEHRRFNPGFPPVSGAVGLGNALFAGGADGLMYSFVSAHPRTGDTFLRWRVQLDGPVTTTPVLHGGGNLLFATQAGTVYSCRAEDKSLRWVFRTGGPILGDPVVDESGVYLGSMDRSLYRLDKNHGTQIWRLRLPNTLATGPVVVAHTVYQFCEGHGLFAVDADKGQQRWVAPTARTFVAHHRDRDVLSTGNGQLDVVDHESGRALARAQVSPFTGAVANPRDDAVFLFTNQGEVLAARMENIPYLRYQQILSARKRLNVGPRAPSSAAHPVPEPVTGPEVDDPFRSSRDVPP